MKLNALCAYADDFAEHPRSYVYFFRTEHGGAIKIGFSKKPDRRARKITLAAGKSVEIITAYPGCRALEQAWHTVFANIRIGGGWFRPSPELLKAIENVRFGGHDQVVCPVLLRSGAENHRVDEWLASGEVSNG